MRVWCGFFVLSFGGVGVNCVGFVICVGFVGFSHVCVGGAKMCRFCNICVGFVGFSHVGGGAKKCRFCNMCRTCRILKV